LKTGLAQKLMNLSQVARYIRPTVEARTQKTVQLGAITMALSRIREELPSLDEGPRLRLAERVTVQRGLVILTYANVPQVQESLLELQSDVRSRRGYMTITEGVREITLIVEAEMAERALEVIPMRPTRISRGVASLSVSLSDANLETPGVLYRLLQPLALQGVNLDEVASTTTEFHVYLAEADVMLALDSWYAAFR